MRSRDTETARSALAPDWRRTVRPLTSTWTRRTRAEPRGRLKLIAINPANNNQPYEWLFHDVNLRPDGDLGLISDEFQSMTLTGTLQAVSAAPYGLSRYMDLVSRRSWSTS